MWHWMRELFEIKLGAPCKGAEKSAVCQESGITRETCRVLRQGSIQVFQLNKHTKNSNIQHPTERPKHAVQECRDLICGLVLQTGNVVLVVLIKPFTQTSLTSETRGEKEVRCQKTEKAGRNKDSRAMPAVHRQQPDEENTAQGFPCFYAPTFMF